MSPPETPAPTRHAPLALWRIAQAFLTVLHNLFGAPEDVAAGGTLTRSAHVLLASWLRAGEALLRRLLLIEAAAFAEVAPVAARGARVAHTRTRRLQSFHPNAPEQWRVCFRCFSRDVSLNQTRAQRSRAIRAGAPLKNAWPLAERYEALIRVFNAPGAFARRLHRRLAHTPGRLHEVLQVAPEAPRLVGGDAFATLDAAARARWRDSS